MKCENCGMHNDMSIVACIRCGNMVTHDYSMVKIQPKTTTHTQSKTHSFEEFDQSIRVLLGPEFGTETKTGDVGNTQSTMVDASNKSTTAMQDVVAQSVATKAKTIKPTGLDNKPTGATNTKVVASPKLSRTEELAKQQEAIKARQEKERAQKQAQMERANLQRQAELKKQAQLEAAKRQQEADRLNNLASQNSNTQAQINAKLFGQDGADGGETLDDHFVPISKPHNPNQWQAGVEQGRYYKAEPDRYMSMLALLFGVVGWLTLLVAIAFQFNLRQMSTVAFVLGAMGFVGTIVAFGLKQNKLIASVALVILIQLIVYAAIVAWV